LSPVVEVHISGVAWIDLEGVVDRSLALREMRRRLRDATGAEPRLGLAPGPFTARVAASRARPGRLLPVERAREFLAPLPVSELGLEPWQEERLELLGLRSLSEVARIGPRQLESQLGREGRLAALRARGLEPDRLQAWVPPRSTSAHRQFEPPLEEREALLFVGRALCDELAAELGLRGAGSRNVTEQRSPCIRSPPWPDRRSPPSASVGTRSAPPPNRPPPPSAKGSLESPRAPRSAATWATRGVGRAQALPSTADRGVSPL